MDKTGLTDILCFECGERYGIDCPGRKPNEATRCMVCFEKFMTESYEEQDENYERYIQELVSVTSELILCIKSNNIKLSDEIIQKLEDLNLWK